jgi:2-(1,2-epoxy-1,2-dihydrophenyl)acetyl-CoA isomerase
MSGDDGVRLRREGDAAYITLDRPAVKNALDRTTWAALGRAVAAAQASPARVVVIGGAGGVFSAGGDLKSMPERLALPYDERRAQLTADAQVIRAIVGLGRPTVALIDGPAMGAGLAIALACDVRLASARSRVSCAFRKIGLAGDFGVSWLLPRLVGRGRALDLLYTGDALSAEEARQIGLIQRVYPDAEFVARAAEYVRDLAEGPRALTLIRRVVDEVAGKSLEDALPIEAAAQAEASQTADAHEGAGAFLEKRPPKFVGN